MGDGSVRIRVLCVDDHPVVLKGVAGLVNVQSDMVVVAEAMTGREAIAQFRAHRPDITLMDLQMPELGGLDAIVAIRGEYPEARIIVLTTYAGDVQALRAIKARSPEVSFELAEHATDDALTPAEVRVLRLIAHGSANKAIAAELSLSEDTI